jgi:hypothetical protein
MIVRREATDKCARCSHIRAFHPCDAEGQPTECVGQADCNCPSFVRLQVKDCGGPLQLRMVIWFSTEHNYYVGHCLESGNVATANDEMTALSMLDELLDDEIALTQHTGNWPNIFGAPAPLEIWKMIGLDLVGDHKCDICKTVHPEPKGGA